MENTSDKNWATKYLLDPLNAPDPSAETGPGTSFRPDSASSVSDAPKIASPTSSGKRLSKNPYRQSSGSVKGPSVTNAEEGRSPSLRSTDQSSPTQSASSQISDLPSHRQEALGNAGTGRRRGSSLNERFPGDKSHRPLDTLTKEMAIADRSRHVTKKHHIQPDTIDNLDHAAGDAYHHGGPYDATLFARNNSRQSPLQAVAGTNAEALKATPKENIIDSVRGHRPLDGVATYAPGESDRNGNVYRYEQGDNMMVDNMPEGGAYKRWPGVQYHPDDIKGKGEPSYSIEKGLKEHESADAKGRQKSMGQDGIEMMSHSRKSSGALNADVYDPGDETQRRSSLSERLSGGGLKKRIGSIKK